MRIPTFYIIGGQKCGTTFLQNALREHPKVFMPASETPFFEDPDYLESTSQNLSDIFSEAKDAQLLGIKRPSYLHKIEVPARIKKIAPHAKLIAILRNPVDRAISAYFHNIRYGFVPPIDPNYGIRSIIDGSMQAKYPRSYEVLDFGFYHRGLMHYLDCFDREQILIIFFNDMINLPQSIYDKTCDFLEIERFSLPDKIIHSRPQAVTYSLPRLRWITKSNLFEYQYNSDKTRLHTNKDKTLLDKTLIKTVKSVDNRILKLIFSNLKPVLEERLKSDLFDIYNSDVEMLEELLRTDLFAWKRI